MELIKRFKRGFNEIIFVTSSWADVHQILAKHCGIDYIHASGIGLLWKTMYINKKLSHFKDQLVVNGRREMFTWDYEFFLSFYYPYKLCSDHAESQGIVRLYQIMTPIYCMLGLYGAGLALLLVENFFQGQIVSRWTSKNYSLSVCRL